jgi:Cu+-exporting ATPase
VLVAAQSKVIGIVGISDPPKPEAYTTMTALASMGLDVWMLTGDCKTTAEAVARELGIEAHRVLAGVTPADKVAKVRDMQANGEVIAMVGDGINDSPALAQADVGIALGAGTQVAVEAADMVLVRNNLHDVVVALHLAKAVFRRIQWNFVWATVYNFIAIPFAAGVCYPWTRATVPPQYAGLAMAFSSVSVVLSSLALKFYKRPTMVAEESSLEHNTVLRRAKDKLVQMKNQLMQPKFGKYARLSTQDEDIEHLSSDGVEMSILV